MDRETLIADLRQACHNTDDAARHVMKMLVAVQNGEPLPRAERSHAAEKLNRAGEIIRRTYHEDW